MSDIEFGSAGAGVNRSGTLTAGGVAQQLAAANPVRKKLHFQNISSGDFWIDEVTGNATSAAPNAAGSNRVPPGQPVRIATNKTISIWGATTGQAWTAVEA